MKALLSNLVVIILAKCLVCDDVEDIQLPDYDVRENFLNCYNPGYDETSKQVLEPFKL